MHLKFLIIFKLLIMLRDLKKFTYSFDDKFVYVSMGEIYVFSILNHKS